MDTAARYLPNTMGGGWKRAALFPLLAGSRLLFALLAIVFYRLDIRAPVKRSGFPKNYVVIAYKPATNTVRKSLGDGAKGVAG